MKTYRNTITENIESLRALVKASLKIESDYETLKLKTEDMSLFQWVEAKQESTTDFILATLSLLKDLSIKNNGGFIFNKEILDEDLKTRSLIVPLNSEVIERECSKIDEYHLYSIIETMAKNKVDSKIYKLLNKRLEKLNNSIKYNQNPPLLVG